MAQKQPVIRYSMPKAGISGCRDVFAAILSKPHWHSFVMRVGLKNTIFYTQKPTDDTQNETSFFVNLNLFQILKNYQ